MVLSENHCSRARKSLFLQVGGFSFYNFQPLLLILSLCICPLEMGVYWWDVSHPPHLMELFSLFVGAPHMSRGVCVRHMSCGAIWPLGFYFCSGGGVTVVGVIIRPVWCLCQTKCVLVFPEAITQVLNEVVRLHEIMLADVHLSIKEELLSYLCLLDVSTQIFNHACSLIFHLRYYSGWETTFKCF